MHTLLLQPSDVLFFRDGRPMTGSLAGHSAAWPLPTITNAALHAALWRAGFAPKAHSHRPHRSGAFASHNREENGERFGSLVTAGPYPVRVSGSSLEWFFPRPFDAVDDDGRPVLALAPVRRQPGEKSSLDSVRLRFAAASRRLPTKDTPAGWWNQAAWGAYLASEGTEIETSGATPGWQCRRDDDIASRETQIGIRIDSETGTTGRGSAHGQIYSAHYLRLREDWRLGVFAQARDKAFKDAVHGDDLIAALLGGGSEHIVVGGQQRICTATFAPATEVNGVSRLPMPLGRTAGFPRAMIDGAECHLVKWVLLSPAIWPEIAAGKSARGTTVHPHPGGWLPNWIEPDSLRMLLRTVSPEVRSARRRMNYNGRGYASDDGAAAINARLVAAIVPKPLIVTGWSLGTADESSGSAGEAKPTHLAVPAGAVYYFAADSAGDAEALAAALNWHGDSAGSTLQRRRSTLLGEKGFGLGVCASWSFLPEPRL